MKKKFYNFFSIFNVYGLYGLLFSLAISNGMVESFAGVMAFGFLGRKIIKPDFRWLKFWPNIFLVLFLFFNALSLLNCGIYLGKGLHALLGKWLQYLGIYVIAAEAVCDEKVFKRGIFIFLAGAILAVFSGLSQYFFGYEFLRHRGIVKTNEGLQAITSTFVQNNGFGGYLVVVLPVLLAVLLFFRASRIKTYALSALSLLSIGAIFLTFSRGSWLAFVVSLFFLAVFLKKEFKWLIPALVIVLLISFFSVFRERIFYTFTVGGDSNRFKYWDTALIMIGHHPLLGMGVGTFMANFPKFLPAIIVSYAHNCYLQMWAEAGIFSLVSFNFFIISVMYLGVKQFEVSRDILLLGLLSAIAGFMTHSFFESNLYSLRLVILFWVCLGFIVSKLKEKSLCRL